MRPRLGEVDDAEQEDRPLAQLEDVADLHWWRDVAEAELVPMLFTSL